jgi:hypothetical protein
MTIAFVQALVRFIRALGAYFNNHPRVAFVQLGLLGFWGEWHTWPRPELFASDATQRTVVDEMRAAFPNKILQARTANGYLGVHPWLGYHDDMFPEDTDGGEAWHFLPNLRRAGRDQNWKVACIGGEMVPGSGTPLAHHRLEHHAHDAGAWAFHLLGTLLPAAGEP